MIRLNFVRVNLTQISLPPTFFFFLCLLLLLFFSLRSKPELDRDVNYFVIMLLSEPNIVLFIKL